MKNLIFFGNAIIKLCKGLFVIYLFLLAITFAIQSCKKTENIYSDKKAELFLEKVKVFRNTVNTFTVNPINQLNLKKNNYSPNNSNEEEVYHVLFDEMPINPDFSYDINGIATLINNYGGTLSTTPSDTSIIFSASPVIVSNSLQPLINEAKVYLNARGLSNAEIENMIIEENTQEYDLVPFATALANYEISGNSGITSNFENILISSAYAAEDPSILHCIGVALGVDALWALGGSNASAWTAAGMKTAFKSVAKRFLGPIGVAIAVVSFGLCMGGYN